jgi:hypothetical protein
MLNHWESSQSSCSTTLYLPSRVRVLPVTDLTLSVSERRGSLVSVAIYAIIVFHEWIWIKFHNNVQVTDISKRVLYDFTIK